MHRDKAGKENKLISVIWRCKCLGILIFLSQLFYICQISKKFRRFIFWCVCVCVGMCAREGSYGRFWLLLELQLLTVMELLV